MSGLAFSLRATGLHSCCCVLNPSILIALPISNLDMSMIPALDPSYSLLKCMTGNPLGITVHTMPVMQPGGPAPDGYSYIAGSYVRFVEASLQILLCSWSMLLPSTVM